MPSGYRRTCPHCGKDIGPVTGTVRLPECWKNLLRLTFPHDLAGIEKGAGRVVQADDPMPYYDDDRQTEGFALEDGTEITFYLASGQGNYWLEYEVRGEQGDVVRDVNPVEIEALEDGWLSFETEEGVAYHVRVEWEPAAAQEVRG